MKFFSFFFTWLFLLCAILATPQQAHAVCADPAAEKGSIVFNDSYSTMQFCDGTVWWDMKGSTGNVWFTSGNGDISYNSGNVGVGTGAPGAALHVAGALLLENSGSCDGGGGNKGAVHLNAAADALEICDGAGNWIPLTADSVDTLAGLSCVSGQIAKWDGSNWACAPDGGGTGGSGPGGSGSVASGWPDAIKCSDGTTETVLYYRNLNASKVAYAPPQVDASPQYILYEKAAKTYFSHSNMAGFDCVTNGWSVADLQTNNRDFSFVGGSIWLTSGSDIFYSSGKVGIGTASPDEVLTVSGGIKFTSGTLTFPDATTMSTAATDTLPGGADRQIQFNSGGILFGADANFVFTASGNVGIGTTTPDEVLTVSGGIKFTSGVLTFPDATTMSTAPAAGGSVDVQEFANSGTWTKPASGSLVRVECIGGGGSGGSRATHSGGYWVGGGGGGGGYKTQTFLIGDLGATEAVTIGGGGTPVTGNATGNPGGNSTFGTKLTAYGGAGGSQGTTSAAGGHGGGVAGPGGGGAGLGGNSASSWIGGSGMLSGGGGGASDTVAGPGGDSIYGGAGGGTRSTPGTTVGGTSAYGGNGGAGSGVAGTAPGGGGGGNLTGAASGAGADGWCRAITW